MAEAPHILVVDDDRRLRQLLSRFLIGNGFRATTADSAADARRKMAVILFDLLVLDIMMPGETGLELTAALREKGNLPILLLTARGDPEDRIAGLERGADDYLAKPFEPRELVARIRSVLRRVPDRPGAADIRINGFLFEPDRECLTRADGQTIALTAAETRLLQLLADKPGQPVDRDDLGRQTDSTHSRSVDVQVNRLRRKLEPNARQPRFLQTARGRGYVLHIDGPE